MLGDMILSNGATVHGELSTILYFYAAASLSAAAGDGTDLLGLLIAVGLGGLGGVGLLITEGEIAAVFHLDDGSIAAAGNGVSVQVQVDVFVDGDALFLTIFVSVIGVILLQDNIAVLRSVNLLLELREIPGPGGGGHGAQAHHQGYDQCESALAEKLILHKYNLPFLCTYSDAKYPAAGLA